MEGLDGGFLDGAVHAFGLAVCPRVVLLGEFVLDNLLITDAVEDVGAQISPGRSISVLWQVCEGHSVVGQHGMDCIGERFDDAAETLCTVHLPSVVAELDVGELGHAIDDKNMLSLPWARRSSLMSMWTYPIAVAANLPRLEL